MRTIFALALLLPAGWADTLVLKNGLELHGAVTEADGIVRITLEGRTREFARDKVREIRTGRTTAEEFAARAQELGSADAAGWYRLALWAREKRSGRVRAALERVIEIDPDHRAARRELGYERVDGAWVSGDDAKRAKGFVLSGGRWVLPAESDRLMRAGLMKQAAVTKDHHRRAEEIAAALLDDDADVRAAAAEMIEEVPDAALLRPMMSKVLYAGDPETRMLAVKTLGRVGDRAALPALIRTSMYDASSKVRATAFRSIQGFGDTDVFYPYARALYSKSRGARIMAAKALATLGDPRGVDVILRRVSIGIGAAGRANILVGQQNSYIQDFDVEIAQAAAIGDPIIQTIRDGIILDYKILGGSGEGYIVERRAYSNALSSLTGRDYGENWKAYRQYATENDLPRGR